MRQQYLFFGQFLRKEGLISDEDIFQARNLQKKHNRRIGEIAIEKGWLTREQVERILVLQEDTKDKFGEIAISQGYLDKGQVRDLLVSFDDSYLFFGEALVRLGVLSNESLVEKLREFNTVFGIGSPTSKTKVSHMSDLSKKRLNMKDCEYMQACDFFNNRMKQLPDEKHIMMIRYCMGDSTNCARYMLRKATGNRNIPVDLSPEQLDRARSLIRQLAV